MFDQNPEYCSSFYREEISVCYFSSDVYIKIGSVKNVQQ